MTTDTDAGDIALSDLQLDVMRVLWRGETSVADVAAELAVRRDRGVGKAATAGSWSIARWSTNRRCAAAWSAA